MAEDPPRYELATNVYVLIILPLMYVLGFLSWSTHAVKNHLGFLPLTLTQYLAPGAIILIIGAIGLFLHAGIMASLKRNNPGLGAHFTWGHVWLSGFSLGIGLAFAFLVFFAIDLTLPYLSSPNHPPFAMVLPAVIGSIVLSGLVFPILVGYSRGLRNLDFPRRWKRNAKVDEERFRQTIGPLPIFCAVIVTFLLFTGFILPNMNQEFGGASERIASFDIDPESLSSITINYLWPDWNPEEQESPIKRTPKARVIFANADMILVKQLEEESGKVVTLPEPSIKAIYWS